MTQANTVTREPRPSLSRSRQKSWLVRLKEWSSIPEGYYYTKEHEWIKQNGSTYLVGITDYAVKMLNDIVYVNFPEVGTTIKSSDVFGQVESVKTVSDVYMPVSGKVLKVNSKLTQTPELLTTPRTMTVGCSKSKLNLSLKKQVDS